MTRELRWWSRPVDCVTRQVSRLWLPWTVERIKMHPRSFTKWHRHNTMAQSAVVQPFLLSAYYRCLHTVSLLFSFPRDHSLLHSNGQSHIKRTIICAMVMMQRLYILRPHSRVEERQLVIFDVKYWTLDRRVSSRIVLTVSFFSLCLVDDSLSVGRQEDCYLITLTAWQCNLLLERNRSTLRSLQHHHR